MKSIYRTKFVIIMLFMLPSLVFHIYLIPQETYGQDETFSWGGLHQNYLDSPDLVNAGMAVKDFFEALCEGRVEVLRELMDENLREEYRLSLDDPSYPSLLRKIYGGNKIVIDDIYRKEVESFVIDARIISPKSGTNEVRFELKQEMENRKDLQPYRFRSFIAKHQ